MAFHSGQKVVCINAEPMPGTLGWHPATDIPVKGAIYTIRALGKDSFDNPAVKLFEICWRGDTHRGFDDDGYYLATRFRPLTERKNDGEAFVEQLKRDCIPSPTKVKEREGME